MRNLQASILAMKYIIAKFPLRFLVWITFERDDLIGKNIVLRVPPRIYKGITDLL